jgi:LPS sulfotransferase NodH
VEPFRIVYEKFVEAYEENVLGLLNSLEIPIPEGFTVEEPKMKRQADELSEEWVRLYNARKATGTGKLSRKG